MPRFVIERRIRKAGQLTDEQLQAISQKACSALAEMGSRVQWVQSFVTDEGLLCNYIAPDEEWVREHARRSGFPADRVMMVRNIIDPTTAAA